MHPVAPLRLAVVLSGAVLLAAYASLASAAVPAKVADGVFVGPNDMTLYTFDRDAVGSGKSVCNGACAVNWPQWEKRCATSASAVSG